MIKAVLNVEYEPDPEHDSGQHGAAGPAALNRQTSDTFDEVWQHSTVFELAGVDRAGLLADVLQLLTINGCDVRSAAVWTYSGRVAFVVSVVEGCGQPVRDSGKLFRLKQLLHQMMDSCGNGIVTAQPVKGLIHYERRLHQLMLKEEEKQWLRNKDAILRKAGILPPDSSCSCSCHQQQGPDGTLIGTASLANGAAMTNSARLTNGLLQQYQQQAALGNGHQQQYQQQLQQLPGGVSALSLASGRCGGCSSCCCQEEQQELHMVRSDDHAAVSQGPTPPHHSPSSSISSLPADQDMGAERLLISPKFSRPDVTIQHYSHLNYWLVTIK